MKISQANSYFLNRLNELSKRIDALKAEHNNCLDEYQKELWGHNHTHSWLQKGDRELTSEEMELVNIEEPLIKL